MKFNKQLFLHNPEKGTIGDCDRTVISCFLDLNPEDVPHFAEIHYEDIERWEVERRNWLRSKGWYHTQNAFNCDLNHLLINHKLHYPGLYYTMTGRSKTGVNHIVICQDDKIIHDPSMNESGIIGPCDDEYYWIGYFIKQ